MSMWNIDKKYTSKDGSIKYRFRNNDDMFLEAVYMPGHNKTKICVSSQIGCSFECAHCATGLAQFKGNLSPSEIIFQIQSISDEHKLFNPEILFYGGGEPLLNLESIIKSTGLLKKGFTTIRSDSQFYIATSGIPGGILRLLKENTDINLTISLHAADQNKRKRLIPHANKYDILTLKRDLKEYQEITKRKVILHYCLIREFNDKEDDIVDLINYVDGLDCEMHIIPFNDYQNASFRTPTISDINWFVKRLSGAGIEVLYKPSRGDDVLAACGQLLANPTYL